MRTLTEDRRSTLATHQEKMGALLRTNRLAILLEIASAVIFGLAHSYQGPAGMSTAFTAGLLLGVTYLAVGRNLWIMVIAHALTDTLSWVPYYLNM